MYVRVTHQWADGTATELEVGTDMPAYPDEAAECVARALDMWRACIAASSDDEADQ